MGKGLKGMVAALVIGMAALLPLPSASMDDINDALATAKWASQEKRKLSSGLSGAEAIDYARRVYLMGELDRAAGKARSIMQGPNTLDSMSGELIVDYGGFSDGSFRYTLTVPAGRNGKSVSIEFPYEAIEGEKYVKGKKSDSRARSISSSIKNGRLEVNFLATFSITDSNGIYTLKFDKAEAVLDGKTLSSVSDVEAGWVDAPSYPAPSITDITPDLLSKEISPTSAKYEEKNSYGAILDFGKLNGKLNVSTYEERVDEIAEMHRQDELAVRAEEKRLQDEADREFDRKQAAVDEIQAEWDRETAAETEKNRLVYEEKQKAAADEKPIKDIVYVDVEQDYEIYAQAGGGILAGGAINIPGSGYDWEAATLGLELQTYMDDYISFDLQCLGAIPFGNLDLSLSLMLGYPIHSEKFDTRLSLGIGPSVEWKDMKHRINPSFTLEARFDIPTETVNIGLKAKAYTNISMVWIGAGVLVSM